MYKAIFVVIACVVAGAGCAEPSKTPPTQGAASDASADSASDTAGADSASSCGEKPAVCCCAGDVAEVLVCEAGAWKCPKGFGQFTGEQCNASKCGGPCSLPCALDASDADGAPGDVSAADSATPDAAPGDAKAVDAAIQDSAAPDSGPADAAAPDSAAVDLAASDATPGSLCAATGGTEGEGQCCPAAGDFPSSCLIGACGCPPQYSKPVKVCNCPSGHCYDPAAGCKTK